MQVLLNNMLYDLSQIGIPFDRADKADLAAPHGWDMPGLVRFTFIMGALSTLFDIATFLALLGLFHVDVATFRAAWFIESMATQILVVFVIRTAGPAWRHRAHPMLVASALGGLAVALLLPFLPVAGLLGFSAPALPVLGLIALLVLIYLLAAEGLKRVSVPGWRTRRS